MDWSEGSQVNEERGEGRGRSPPGLHRCLAHLLPEGHGRHSGVQSAHAFTQQGSQAPHQVVHIPRMGPATVLTAQRRGGRQTPFILSSLGSPVPGLRGWGPGP